jgi:hypothetical protein
MTRIGLDPDGNVVNEHCALIYAPRRRRDRFPENCVQLVESEAMAMALVGADAQRHLYAARVLGPSRPSEGFRLY